MIRTEERTLRIPRKSYIPLNIFVEDEDGNPIDITGKTIVFTIKKKLSDPLETPIISHTIVIHVDPTNGQSFTDLTATETDIDDPKAYQFEFRLITGTDPTVFDRGIVYFEQDVLIEP